MVKKIASYVLIAVVLVVTLISLLAVWDIIDVEHVMRKVLTSMFILFIAAVVTLFIFAVIIKDGNTTDNNRTN